MQAPMLKWCQLPVFALTCLVTAVMPCRALAEVVLKPVATSGQEAPGLEAATYGEMGSYGSYRITGSGKLAFSARAVYEKNRYSEAVWIQSDDTTTLALETEFTEDASKCDEIAEAPFLFEDGNVIVLCNTFAPEKGLFYGPPGAMVKQLGTNDLAPSDTAPPFTFWQISKLKVREPGLVAFEGSFDIPTVNMTGAGHGVWIWSPTSLHFVVSEGSPAPGTEAQHVEEAVINDLSASGRVLIGGTRSGSSPVHELWVGTSSSDITRVAQDDPSAVPSSERLRVSTRGPGNRISDSDELTVLDAENHVVWVGPAGGELVPLADKRGNRFSVETIEVSPHGRMAFFGSIRVAGEYISGLWVGTASDLKLIARQGSKPRGLSAGTLEDIASIQLNERGQMVLSAYIQEKDETRRTLLRYSPAGGFESIVQLDAIVDDHGTKRAISDYRDFCDATLEDHDGCLDEDGRFVLSVTYSDKKTGLVLTDPMPAGGKDIPIDLGDDADSPDDGGTAGVGGGGASGSEEGGGRNSGAGPSPSDPGRGEQTGAGGAAETAPEGSGSGASQRNDDGCSIAATRGGHTRPFGSLAAVLGALTWCARVRRRSLLFPLREGSDGQALR